MLQAPLPPLHPPSTAHPVTRHPSDVGLALAGLHTMVAAKLEAASSPPKPPGTSTTAPAAGTCMLYDDTRIASLEPSQQAAAHAAKQAAEAWVQLSASQAFQSRQPEAMVELPTSVLCAAAQAVVEVVTSSLAPGSRLAGVGRNARAVYMASLKQALVAWTMRWCSVMTGRLKGCEGWVSSHPEGTADCPSSTLIATLLRLKKALEGTGDADRSMMQLSDAWWVHGLRLWLGPALRGEESDLVRGRVEEAVGLAASCCLVGMPPPAPALHALCSEALKQVTTQGMQGMV